MKLTNADPASADFKASADWKLFFGLSRTPHGLLDVATPAMAAVLWLGHLPSASIILIGLVTAFAGYNAVYALNDLIDCRVDKERLSLRETPKGLFHVDEILVRHPIAQGLLPFKNGLTWCAFWGMVAAAGAWWLNPFCLALFAVCSVCEFIYCKLLRVTHLKIIPSAIVKATGGLAGVYAVDPHPALGFVAVLFLWLAAWEMGGQNIANDIVDRDDDLRVSAKTTSTVKGVQESVFRLLTAVSMAAFGGFVIYWWAGTGVGRFYPLGALLLGWYLLLGPARALYYNQEPSAAASLFNRASYVPVSFLALIMISLYIPI
jgi:4-hydroxybenzoate polyprenyltransferase